MSAKATFWAWEQSLKSSEKLVLLCLADCHNGDNGRCDPSAKYVALKTGLNIKTIPSALKNLSEMKLITTEKRPGTSPSFTLNLPHIWVTPKTGVPQKRVNPKTDETLPNIGVGGTPKTGDEPIKNLKENLKDIYKGISLEDLPTDLSRIVVMEFIDYRAKKKSPLDQAKFNRILKKALDISSKTSLSAEQVFTETMDRGWAGFDLKYFNDYRIDANANNRSSENSSGGRQQKLSAVGRVREAAERQLRELDAQEGDDPTVAGTF